MVELENVTLCARCSNPALFALVTMYVNPNYLEVSHSSEKKHPDLARISIDIYIYIIYLYLSLLCWAGSHMGPYLLANFVPRYSVKILIKIKI